MTELARPAGMSIADFMNHSTRGGGKKNYLSGWKAKDPYAVTVWLSCLASIYTLCRHGFYRVEPRENRESKEKTLEVWQNKLVCYETEENLGKRYFRDKATGEREYPPELCPHCKLIEDVYQRCLVGNETMRAILAKSPKATQAEIEKELERQDQICWLTPLFAFKGADSSKDVVLHAGGLYNAFGSKDLTADDKALMARVPKDMGGPIYAKHAWKENQQPKTEYVYCVVDNDKVADGIQIAIETSLLGDKMKTEIAKQMKRDGAEKGNPILNPYAFRWEFNPADGIEFNKKYEVTAMPTKLTPAVEKMIRDTPPPDLAPLLARFNLKSHRASLEKHALVQLPWDEYFEAALKLEGEKGQQAAEAAERPREVGRNVPVPVPMARAARGPDAQPARPLAPAPEEELVACDGKLPSGQECGNAIRLSDPQCPACGTKFDVQGEEPPPPPVKPALRSRGAAKASAAAAPATTPAAAIGPAPRGSLGALAPPADAFADDAGGGGSGGYPGDPGDDIPFASNSVLIWCVDGVASESWEYGRRCVGGNAV